MAQVSRNLYLDEDGFVFDYYSGLTYSLNSTGVFILRELLEGTSLPEITRALEKKYHITHQTASSDTNDFLRQLSSINLLGHSEVTVNDSM